MTLLGEHKTDYFWNPYVSIQGAEMQPETLSPVAGKDLLRYLDGDVTLLSPLVQIQQVSSET